MKSGSPFRKCPRCKEKCFVHEKACHECGLIFDRLNYTSNKTAKKLLLKGKYKDTIKTNTWPYDAKKSTALWLCALLGYTGAHNFYLGRFVKGGVSLFGFVMSILMVVLTDYIYGTAVWNYLYLLVVIPGACVLMFWFSDLLSIIFEKYKIPVAIDENLLKIKENIIENEKKPINTLKYNKKSGKSKQKNNSGKNPEKINSKKNKEK